MPATNDRYLFRNARIGEKRKFLLPHGTARPLVNGKPVEDGTVVTIIDAFDFDYPYMFKLPDGSITRGFVLSSTVPLDSVEERCRCPKCWHEDLRPWYAVRKDSGWVEHNESS